MNAQSEQPARANAPRLELLNVMAELERQLGQPVLDGSTSADSPDSAPLEGIGGAESRRRTASRPSERGQRPWRLGPSAERVETLGDN